MSYFDSTGTHHCNYYHHRTLVLGTAATVKTELDSWGFGVCLHTTVTFVAVDYSRMRIADYSNLHRVSRSS